MSTTAKHGWLRLLKAIGVRSFAARSGLGLPFICRPGDLASTAPFLNRDYSVAEIAIMAAWCNEQAAPVVFDVGANDGFVACQLAQLLRTRQPRIFAFEPVPTTFAALRNSITALGLRDLVFPISCALGAEVGTASIAYDERESLFAQVRADTPNVRAGNNVALCPVLTVDDVVDSLQVSPTLMKIDVEGSEKDVLLGATELLRSDPPPAICLEWNPITMHEVRTAPEELLGLLPRGAACYVDDFEGQRIPFGEPIADPMRIDWVCNIFVVPPADANKINSIVAAAHSLVGLALEGTPPAER